METHTPYFRAALTIAAVWIAVFGFLSYSEYRDAYHSSEYAAFGMSDQETFLCNDIVPDAKKSGIEWRDPTSEERSACFDTAARQHLSWIESSNQFALEHALKSFGWKGALPAMLLLAIVACWKIIMGGVSYAGSSYIRWLRFGVTKSESKCEGDKKRGVDLS